MRHPEGNVDSGGPDRRRTREAGFRSGFVAIVGRPNVGKSTLLNSLLREKVAIVSDKPQTTRNKIRGILTGEGYQIVFIDTPGIHNPRDGINRYMVRMALAALREVDLVLWMVEADDRVGKEDPYVQQALGALKTPVFVLVNKMDSVPERDRHGLLERFRGTYPGRPLFAVSALTGQGLEAVLDRVVEMLPKGQPHFPADQYTDHTVRFLSAEVIREKAFQFTGEEVPYAVAVEIVSFREDGQGHEQNLVAIEANIHVERSSQKAILIGKGGQMLKRIGTAARLDLEGLLGTRVFLKIWVKVSKGWRNDPKKLWNLGYR